MRNIISWIQGFDYTYLIGLLLSTVAVIIALSVHECCHGLMAYWLGDDTAKRQGRLSLNPFRHIDWVGFVMLTLFHFGWARPVQVDMRRLKHPKAGMALTALAGPVSNILLALIAAIFVELFWGIYISSGSYLTGENWLYYLVQLFVYIELINIGLAIFNLIPIPPLDGSKVLAVVLPDRLYLSLMRFERYGMILLVVLLFTNVLDVPLNFLRNGLQSGLEFIARPVADFFLNLIY